MSKMRESMISQPDELARLLADEAPAKAAANRLAGRRVRLIGIGTSWHAAHHGAWLLREAGIEAEALHAADIAPYGRAIDPADGVIVLSHTGGTGYSMTMLERAREAGAETLYISGIGNGGDIETVAAEQSYAYTASHTAALLVLAQIATRLGAQLGPLDAIAHEFLGEFGRLVREVLTLVPDVGEVQVNLGLGLDRIDQAADQEEVRHLGVVLDLVLKQRRNPKDGGVDLEWTAAQPDRQLHGVDENVVLLHPEAPRPDDRAGRAILVADSRSQQFDEDSYVLRRAAAGWPGQMGLCSCL
jgi:hypothetical protein